MRAVVECVTDNAPPPVELRLAWQCKNWNTLPDDGGLYAQDYRTMYRMNTLSAIHNAIIRIKSLKGKEIHKLGDNDRLILKMLMDQGLLFNA